MPLITMEIIAANVNVVNTMGDNTPARTDNVHKIKENSDI
jgi:hypothetical protein